MEVKSSIESSSSSSDHDPNKWLQRLLEIYSGVDISFLKDDSSVACGTLVVLDFETLDVVYEDSVLVQIEVPYVAGFLGFREALAQPVILEFWLIFPQLLHHVDGLTNSKVRELMEAEENLNFISLIGDSGNILGAVTDFFGHRVSLASAVEVVRITFKYRVPEPIRQVPWSNERPLENKELNAIIGAWFTLWRD
ncbi:endonuclease V [Tanacetum coccineum]